MSPGGSLKGFWWFVTDCGCILQRSRMLLVGGWHHPVDTVTPASGAQGMQAGWLQKTPAQRFPCAMAQPTLLIRPCSVLLR